MHLKTKSDTHYVINEIEKYHLRIQNLIMTAGENINIFHYLKHRNVFCQHKQVFISTLTFI